MDYVFPLRERRDPKFDVLRWTLRSVFAHAPEGRIVVIGGKPDWLDYSQVVHVPTSQGPRAGENIDAAYRGLLDTEGSEEFIWWADDTMLLSDTDFPLYARHTPLATYAQQVRVRYQSMKATYLGWYSSTIVHAERVLRDRGVDTEHWPTYAIHAPQPTTRSRLRAELDSLSTYKNPPLGGLKPLLPDTDVCVRMDDPKVMRADDAIGDGPIVSLSAPSWRGRAGDTLRKRFTQPSPVEVTP